MSKPNVTRVQSATQWTASVHTLHMSKPNVTRVQSATQWTASCNVKRPASNLSTIAGTQSLDRAWQELKNWLPPKLVAFSKKNGHTLMCDRVEELLFQWVWRKHVLPCSPKEFLKQLVLLLKKT